MTTLTAHIGTDSHCVSIPREYRPQIPEAIKAFKKGIIEFLGKNFR